MIQFDGPFSLNCRVVCSMAVGFITHIDARTYTVKWLDGAESTQLRPDLGEPEEFWEAAE